MLGVSWPEIIVFVWSQYKGRQYNNESVLAFVKTKEYVLGQNKDYVGGETC